MNPGPALHPSACQPGLGAMGSARLRKPKSQGLAWGELAAPMYLQYHRSRLLIMHIRLPGQAPNLASRPPTTCLHPSSWGGWGTPLVPCIPVWLGHPPLHPAPTGVWGTPPPACTLHPGVPGVPPLLPAPFIPGWLAYSPCTPHLGMAGVPPRTLHPGVSGVPPLHPAPPCCRPPRLPSSPAGSLRGVGPAGRPVPGAAGPVPAPGAGDGARGAAAGRAESLPAPSPAAERRGGEWRGAERSVRVGTRQWRRRGRGERCSPWGWGCRCCWWWPVSARGAGKPGCRGSGVQGIQGAEEPGVLGNPECGGCGVQGCPVCRVCGVPGSPG